MSRWTLMKVMIYEGYYYYLKVVVELQVYEVGYWQNQTCED